MIRTVEVYILSLGDHRPDPLSGRLSPQAQRLRSIVEVAVLAERCGFSGIAIGEHHFHDYIVSCPELLLAAVAGRTSTLRLATGVTLLAHADPVRVAEQLNTLDVISEGRAESTVARGVSRETWSAFGLSGEAEVRAQFEEKLPLLLQLLTDDVVTWHGRCRAPLESAHLQPRPVQCPRPPIWIGGGLSTVSAELAAKHGLPLMLPSTLRPPATHQPIVRHYREHMDAQGYTRYARVGLPVHVFVGTSNAEAHTAWLPYLESYARFANQLRGAGPPASLRQLLAGPAICGDPPTVAARLNTLTRLLGLDRLLVMFDVGGLPHRAVLANVQRFGEQVLPLLTGTLAPEAGAPG